MNFSLDIFNGWKNPESWC